MMLDTPHAYIKQLCTYLKNDADVAMHTNRNFGTKVTAQRVAQIRSTLPQRRRA